ncbi:hypothetical protein G5B35_18020 [Parapusillimonas sp. SGNA-6]|uniref:hypothetical protein n=1 Tax=Parapedobacter sp. SGR-10 TaxID=2710879 RepID=UPI0013D5BAF8|nr:hypothetical protein [Parapedobacter sp. SGR-10]NGF57031.1 hypothetical protein [Parapedobacter sp. SGR-10]NGM89193.1 hypothetical protein [Parapusillimonas sp. SGNA-6]
MKTWISTLCFCLVTLLTVSGQTNTQHFDKLVLKKKEKKMFSDRDSSSVVYIDTLIMKDKSSLQFFGKKDVKLVVKHAEIDNQAMIMGQGGQNNGSNFDIAVNFQKLGSLYIIARGQDAMNGTKTFPNGDAGNVTLTYDSAGITPQSTDKKAKNYVLTDVTPGGLHVTPSAELNNIYGMIARAPQGLRGLPQGQIYSGSPGKEGKVVIKGK